MFNIIERLDKNVFDPYIVVRQEGGGLYDEILSKGYTIILHPFSEEMDVSILGKLKKIRKLTVEFKKYKFDIWQSFNWSSDFTEAIVARLVGAKYVYVKKNMNWQRRAWKLKTLFSNAVIARNKTLIETYFSPSYFKKKTFFITGGVEVAKFKPGIETTIRKTFNISDSAFLVVCIAQLTKVKDQATLIKAVSRLDNVHLILAGAHRDEEYVAELKRLVEELNISKRVLMPGPISNVNELLNAASIFVLPTSKHGGHEEGCPVSVLEAMAVGTPCIVSDVAGSRDLIINNETGTLFEPGNVDELTAAVRNAIIHYDHAKQMAGTALKKVNAEHTLEIEALAFSKVYKQILGRK